MKKTLFISFALSFILMNAVQAQRKVLVEQFTNSGCPNCVGNTPVVAAYVNDNPDQVLMLSYHASFPYNDSMYHENAFQSDQRISYYNVFGVPTSRVDGNYFSGNLVPVLATTIDNRSAIAPGYAINFTSSILTNETISVTVHFESINAANEGQSFKAMIVVAEKNVLKSSYAASPGNNSETQYPWVVRKMLPDENGTALVNTVLNGIDDVTVSWTADNFKDLNEMRVIAFVQNTATKEVYQAEISAPEIATGTDEIASQSNSSFQVYPSLTNKDFLISINNLQSDMQFSVMDVAGNLFYTSKINSTSIKIDTATFPAGVYLIQVISANKVETKRVILIK